MVGYMDLGVVINGSVADGEILWGDWICGLEWVRRLLMLGTISEVGAIILQLRFSDGSLGPTQSVGNLTSDATVVELPTATGGAFRLGVVNSGYAPGTAYLAVQAFM